MSRRQLDLGEWLFLFCTLLVFLPLSVALWRWALR